MKQTAGFVHMYLWIALLVGIAGIIDGILTILNFSPEIYVILMFSVWILFFFFNVLAIAFFHHHHVEKIAFVLPVYFVLSSLVFLGLAFWFGTIEAEWPWIVSLIVGFAASVFEIGFSAYLLKRFKAV